MVLRSRPAAEARRRASGDAKTREPSAATGAAGAGRKAMEILSAGGSIEDAAAALAVRREIDPGM